jgi:hypothetical protein
MRTRSNVVSITSNTKIKLSNEIANNPNMADDLRKSLIENYIQNNDTIPIATKPSKKDYIIDLKPPHYTDVKKEYITKDDKPIMFHERARVVNTLNKKYIGDIEQYSQHVDFQTFLSIFKNEEEIDAFEIQDLLNLDFERIGELKGRATELLEASTQLKENTQESDELLLFFCDKMNDLKRNEINVQLFVNNIHKVDSLVFSENKTQVYFNQ